MDINIVMEDELYDISEELRLNNETASDGCKYNEKLKKI